jgi:2-dehydropantoate 2-reductase
VRVGVLGPGGVGGALAVRLALAGNDVVCVGTAATVAAIRKSLVLEWLGERLEARPAAVEVLDQPVDLLLVTVKAPRLRAATDRIRTGPRVVLPLMNGLEHLERLRRVFPARVAAGSIRIEAYAAERGHLVQESPFTAVRMASDDVPLDGVAAVLRRAGIETRIVESERAVLWEKAARLAALAPATALTQRPVGELRADPEWRATLEAAIAEACAVATADGAPSTPAAHWAIIDTMPDGLSTSAARDVAAGRPSELDAITGAVVRAARGLGVATPTLDDLLARCRAL